MVNSGERKTIALKFFLKLKELEYSTKKGESPVNLIIYHPAPRTVPTWAHSPSFEVRLFKGLKTGVNLNFFFLKKLNKIFLIPQYTNLVYNYKHKFNIIINVIKTHTLDLNFFIAKSL